MDEAKLMQDGRAVYETFCAALAAEDWKFTRHDDDMVLTCGARGEDLPMEILVRVDYKRSVITLLSRLPVVFAEDKRIDGNLAVCIANQGMVHGSFDYNNMKGQVHFRLTNAYHGCKVSADLCMYMIYCACSTIDNYNDKFLMLSKGMITLEQFIKSEQE